jgi:hypothetical protein
MRRRMNAILFDRLRLSRTLRDKGHFRSEPAEALADVEADISKWAVAAIGFQTLVISTARVALGRFFAK